MPPNRRAFALALVVGVALGCSATSAPLPTPGASAPVTPDPSPVPLIIRTSPPAGPANPSPAALPPHEVVIGPNVAGAFDLATDGTAIVWSSGAVDVDAPALWSLDPATGKTSLVYRSSTPGAILANLAVRHGTYAFAEVTPRAGGSRTWRLVLLDAAGRPRVLDTNDVPASQTGALPMAALSGRGVLWATTHAGETTALRCDLRYASLVDARPQVVASAPCSRTEFWYPRSDGRRFVYGTVEYAFDGAADERHVYLIGDADVAALGHPRRLDVDGQASLPAISGDAVAWKAAPHDLNMFSPAGLVELDLSTAGAPRQLQERSPGALQLTTPSIGPGFIVGEDATGGTVTAWDRERSVVLEVDRLAPTDAGFISGTRLSGRLLAWFYTSSAQGGGMREIRWLSLPAGWPAGVGDVSWLARKDSNLQSLIQPPGPAFPAARPLSDPDRQLEGCHGQTDARVLGTGAPGRSGGGLNAPTRAGRRGGVPCRVLRGTRRLGPIEHRRWESLRLRNPERGAIDSPGADLRPRGGGAECLREGDVR